MYVCTYVPKNLNQIYVGIYIRIRVPILNIDTYCHNFLNRQVSTYNMCYGNIKNELTLTILFQRRSRETNKKCFCQRTLRN